MTTKQPDRWERMIIKQVNSGESYDPFFHYDDVIKLLRKEHQAVVRIIQAMQANSWSFNEVDAYVNGYQRATYDLLSKLTERAK